jgi:hypothetical protein
LTMASTSLRILNKSQFIWCGLKALGRRSDEIRVKNYKSSVTNAEPHAPEADERSVEQGGKRAAQNGL